MKKDLLVPDIGDFENVEIIELLVKQGQKISINDPIVTLESDKSSVEVPSTEQGIIESISVKIGDKVSKGDKLVSISIEGGSEKIEEVKEVKQVTKLPVVEENKPIEKPKRGKKKVKEIKPDYVLLELAELEAINEEDLSEEQEDRLMELRRIKTQRAMHIEADEQFQSEMKQADEEIKTLKSQLKIKEPLPKGYIE